MEEFGALLTVWLNDFFKGVWGLVEAHLYDSVTLSDSSGVGNLGW